MNRIPIKTDLDRFPAQFHCMMTGAKLYDSSCSAQAQVVYIEKGSGYYLKSAPRGTLQAEADLTRQFHRLELAAEVLEYIQADRDWLLTRRIPGEDCTHRQYLDDPKRLSALLGELLRALHETDASALSIRNRTKCYITTAVQNFHAGKYDTALFPDNWGYRSAEEAFQVVQEFAPFLKTDTLIHGDYCLPNIMLDNWQFTGFIDLDTAGLGDRHIDLFWGTWSLDFNLKTDAYRDRFLDAYGRDRIDPEILHAISAFEVFG